MGAAAVSCHPLDVADADALRHAAEEFTRQTGTPDIVIANAGVSSGTLTEHQEDLAVIRRILEINVFGMAATFSPFIAAMQEHLRAHREARSAAGDGGLLGRGTGHADS